MQGFVCDQTDKRGEATSFGTPPTGWLTVLESGVPPTRHFSNHRALVDYYAGQLGLRAIVPPTQEELNALVGDV